MPLKVLLTDEELATQAHAIFKTKGMPIIDELRELTQAIAKAQLRKVVEMLGAYRVDMGITDKVPMVYLRILECDWQALLDEVKEDDCTRFVNGICELGHQACVLTMFHPNCKNRKTLQPDGVSKLEEVKDAV